MRADRARGIAPQAGIVYIIIKYYFTLRSTFACLAVAMSSVVLGHYHRHYEKMRNSTESKMTSQSCH